jgi:hypothetical protein
LQHFPERGKGFGGQGFGGDAAHGVAFGLMCATKAALGAPVQPAFLPDFCAGIACARGIWRRGLGVVNLAP